jgi:hypothetical protein
MPEVTGGPWLLGVEWGYISSHEQGYNNTGVSGVVPAWHLLDLLNTQGLVGQRKLEQEAEKKRTGEGKSVETDAPKLPF